MKKSELEQLVKELQEKLREKTLEVEEWKMKYEEAVREKEGMTKITLQDFIRR